MNICQCCRAGNVDNDTTTTNGATNANPRNTSLATNAYLALSAEVPFRFAALHNCYDSVKENFFMNLILVVLPKRYRARFLTHHQKTYEELCMVGLVPYGIQQKSLPITDQNKLDQERIHCCCCHPS